ncbi:hypothetical protein WJX72_007624 [[Myrmecia] bisecta]|uniref:Trafficking protein particle complex subunit n=1 Tax=[Myrmecia] bisecta TaxID=41462 RepID=A0AAW1R8R0_9CHLO
MDPIAANPAQLGAPLRIGESCTFHSFKTNNYKLHFLESPSGLKMVLNTDADVGDLREHLAYIYRTLYVDYVMKNPVYSTSKQFNFELFTANLNKYIKSLGM